MNTEARWTEDELNDAWDDFLKEGHPTATYVAGDPRFDIAALYASDTPSDPDPLFVTRARALLVGQEKQNRRQPKSGSSHPVGFVSTGQFPLQIPSMVHYVIAIAAALLLIGMLSLGALFFDTGEEHSAVASAIASTVPRQPTPIPTMIGSTIATE